jgi:hypothetical protein
MLYQASLEVRTDVVVAIVPIGIGFFVRIEDIVRIHNVLSLLEDV